MVVQEEFTEQKDVTKLVALFCSNQATGEIRDRDTVFRVVFKDVRPDQVVFASVECNQPNVGLDDYQMRPLEASVHLGGNIYLFDAIPIGPKSISVPDTIRAHPKRKYPRIKIAGNQFISKMFASLSMKVVDFTVQDEELAKKIHLIIATIESHLMRSENYDIAKVSLFDGSEKNIITRLIKKHKRPFVVFDSTNFKVKDDLTLSYEDYIKTLSEEGYDLKRIMAQLDKVKEFYTQNHIISEAIYPLVFEDEAIGQIRVVSLKEKLAKAQVRRMITLAQNAVDNLLEKCSFEIVTKEPQILFDLSVGGAKIQITETEMYKYIRLMKRCYIQLNFPDETQIKCMATMINIYDDTPEGYKVCGLKFSANIDWRDKDKLNEFIQSVLRLQDSERE